jgi:hypothetical protein
MQDPKHTVLKPATHEVTTDDGSFTTPTVPGTDHYSQNDQWIIAYGPAVNRTHPALAMCRNIKNSTWLIVAEQSVIDQIDPTGKGKTIEESGQNWPIWRYDGTKPDPSPEAKQGDRVNVSRETVKFDGTAPDLSSASELVPIGITGDQLVTKAWPSLDSTIAGHDFVKVVEPASVAVAELEVIR